MFLCVCYQTLSLKRWLFVKAIKDSQFMVPVKTGSCLCGAIRFTVKAELKPPDVCHCIQCRKHSGHFFASTAVPRDAVEIVGQDKLAWCQSSIKARRGFCSVCGASLFFDPPARD